MFTSCCRRTLLNASSEITPRRTLSTVVRDDAIEMLNGDFVLHRQVFDVPEQKILLSASLDKLNRTEGKQYRKRRKQYYDTAPPLSSSSTIHDLFLPEDYYDFQQGHYDGVIKNFREMHVSSWSHDTPGLQHLLHRIRQFHPDEETQTHLLHLASDGDIQPHVDHLSAFGSWIVGISLGANRIMRLEKVVPGGRPPIDIILPSGSLYLQKNVVRYEYKHSILSQASLNEQGLPKGQRLSIMIRNRHGRQPIQNL